MLCCTGLTSDQFIDWVILLGNDYTKQYPRISSYNISIDDEFARRYDNEAYDHFLLRVFEAYETDRVGAFQLRPREIEPSSSSSSSSSVWKDSILLDGGCSKDNDREDRMPSVDMDDGMMKEVMDEEEKKVPSGGVDHDGSTYDDMMLVYAELQLAIDYSRAVYNLLPLDAFPIDDDDDDDNDDDGNSIDGEEDDDEDFVMNFSGSMSASEEHIDEYIESLSETYHHNRNFGVSEYAINYFRWLRDKYSNHGDHSNDDEDHGDDNVFLLSEEQLLALEHMSKYCYTAALDAERNRAGAIAPNSNNSKGKGGSSSMMMVEHLNGHLLPRPRWTHVVASHAFQRTCYTLYKKMKGPNSTTMMMKLRQLYQSPKCVFDGVVFHRLLLTPDQLQRYDDDTRSRHDSRSSSSSIDGITGGVQQMMITSSMQQGGLISNREKIHSKSQPSSSSLLSSSSPSIAIMNNNSSNNGAFELNKKIGSDADYDDNHNNNNNNNEYQDNSSIAKKDVLPIDAYREEIIRRINRDRVTIIHGETGCGKSSCLPRFLLEHAEEVGKRCKITVSQPRRIAVTSLLRRLRQTMGDKVGMRMGHGIKDETVNTKITFVTTGYLVRLLAHHPDSFMSYTHLIIDEVHERSVDGDLVCLLARRLLTSHPTIRIILMSATIHTSLYQTYFQQYNDGTYGDMECLSVGIRRFPSDISYVEDIKKMCEDVSKSSKKDSKFKAIAPTLQKECKDILTQVNSDSCKGVVSDKLPIAQYKAVISLVRMLAVDGTGILVFVSGINDITEIIQLFEPYPRYLLFPIHSDIPNEEQELAFGPTPSDKVKVVVATNAAESSVTIPDCDSK